MKTVTVDANGAVSYVSYAFSEVIAIYPITPSSPMAEQADEWASKGKTNLFGQLPKVVEMQSESGAAGVLHGSLTCGAMSTTYTCSQGLLLMLPNMYKITGELLPAVFHVSARALSTHALNIFGDHQDVMACRQSGFAMLCSSSVQEAADLALVSHLVAVKASLPFLHFFDGFRTSHETAKIELPDYAEMQKLFDFEALEKFKARALDSKAPVQRGTAQNGDIYFQNREAANGFYAALPKLVQDTIDEVALLTRRPYRLFDYVGASDAQSVLIMMGSGVGTAEETVEKMNTEGKKVGLVKVRLYRPFSADALASVLPKTCKNIAVLDRTKEAGALGEPLYLDVCSALFEKEIKNVRVVGGRYGLGQKEFTPSACFAVFENLEKAQPKNHFTVGILDDITHTSLPMDKTYHATPSDCVECKFYGLGSDGTVGANKNSIQIIGSKTPLYVQGYFAYDSKKSGGVTISHLRFGKSPIRSSYLIERADFIACHNPSYVTRYDMLSDLKEQGTFLLNAPWTTLQELETNLPAAMKREIAKKRVQFFVIDGTKIAKEVGLNGKTSTVMQAAFFFVNPSIMPYAEAVNALKENLKEKFALKGDGTVEKNHAAVDRAATAVQKIEYPKDWETANEGEPLLKREQGAYMQNFIRPILELKGDTLPVSAFRADGSVPTGTTRLEKHGVAQLIPKWIPENCIQCNQCSFVCPHACIRPFLVDGAQETEFTCIPAQGIPDKKYRIQVSAHDCMGCSVCANVCPAKDKALVMQPAEEMMPTEGKNWEIAQSLPKVYQTTFKRESVKGSQFYPPLFEFSYACSGCGETPYIKLLTQLFGEKMLIANATGCSSIYGGSAPTCPYTVNDEGRGPAWANSLFEDNAEFGLGMKLGSDARYGASNPQSVWLIGGDGWAYDIGFGGLDHVLALGENVNALVLDSEVYSNTGGQASKATPLGAKARFAASGKRVRKKDLALMAMCYGYVYVAQVSMGANMPQLITALKEAEAYKGPSLIIAYSPCIAHGVDLSKCMHEERLAVESGYWPLFRYNPQRKNEGENPFTLDSKPPIKPLREFLSGENRFAALKKSSPEHAEALFEKAEQECASRRRFYEKLAEDFKGF